METQSKNLFEVIVDLNSDIDYCDLMKKLAQCCTSSQKLDCAYIGLAFTDVNLTLQGSSVVKMSIEKRDNVHELYRPNCSPNYVMNAFQLLRINSMDPLSLICGVYTKNNSAWCVGVACLYYMIARTELPNDPDVISCIEKMGKFFYMNKKHPLLSHRYSSLEKIQLSLRDSIIGMNPQVYQPYFHCMEVSVGMMMFLSTLCPDKYNLIMEKENMMHKNTHEDSLIYRYLEHFKVHEYSAWEAGVLHYREILRKMNSDFPDVYEIMKKCFSATCFINSIPLKIIAGKEQCEMDFSCKTYPLKNQYECLSLFQILKRYTI